MNFSVNRVANPSISFKGVTSVYDQYQGTSPEYDESYLKGLLEDKYENVKEYKNCFGEPILEADTLPRYDGVATGHFYSELSSSSPKKSPWMRYNSIKINSKAFTFQLGGGNGGLSVPEVFKLYNQLLDHIRSFKI